MDEGRWTKDEKLSKENTAGARDKNSINIIAPGMLTLTSQYKIPEKKTTPNKYPIINRPPASLFSSAKKSGINAIHASGHKLNPGYVTIKRVADKIGKILIFRSIFYI